MITENQVSEAVEYLRRNSPIAAKARAERNYLEEFTRVIKSTIMSEKDGSIASREMEAYSDKRYKDHLEALKIAVEEDEKHRYLMKAAEIRIEVWRSEQATERALGKA